MVGHDANLGSVEPRQRLVAEELRWRTTEHYGAVQARQTGDFLRHHADVMTHEHHGDAVLNVEKMQEAVEASLGFGIDAAGRLVQQEQLRVRDERSRD
jgi:hypothetical protein